MNNVFNRVKMLKSSEYCYKYSKSVSYETLVDGTTTTGTGKKQTRRVFLGDADKPLSAVGTLTSLLCNSAKVVEKLLHRHSEPKAKNPKKTGTVMPDLIGHLSRIKKEAAEIAFGAASQAPCLGSRLLSCPKMTILWILRLRLRMTIPVLALLFTIATTTELWAGKICNCGTKGHETECCWEIKEITSDGKTEKILTVSAGIDNNGGSYKDVQMNDFSPTKDENGNSINNAPWKEYADEITSIEVNGVKNIGNRAFIAMKNVASASIDNSVISVGIQSFSGNKKLVSINFSDSLETIDAWAFSGCPELTTIEIPDTVKSIGAGAFWYYPITTDISVPDSAVISQMFAFGGRNVKIICRGTDATCADMREKLSHYCTNTATKCVNEEEFIDLSDRVVLADANNCDSSKYYWSGTSCNNKKNGINCAKNWKQNEDFCNRIRYTPAEAAEVLRDDDKNEVTITFKK